MADLCYNTTYRMSIKMTLFMALYGYDAPNLVDLPVHDSRVPKAQDYSGTSKHIENLQGQHFHGT